MGKQRSDAQCCGKCARKLATARERAQRAKLKTRAELDGPETRGSPTTTGPERPTTKGRVP